MARAQCSGAAEEWLCRLGRARLLEAGLGTGRGSCRQWLVRTGAAVAVATATRGYGRRRCRRSEAEQNQARVGRALRRLGRVGDEVNEKPTPPPPPPFPSHFISLKRQPNSHFRYYSEFEPQPASPET